MNFTPKKSMPDKNSKSSLGYYLKCIVLAFYSKRLYKDVFLSWRGYGTLYMFLVLSIASIPFSVRSIIDFNYFFTEELLAPIQSIPLLYIQKGEVIFDKPMPYFIKNKAGNVTAIVDTTSKINEINNQYPNLMILITKHALHFKSPVANLFFIDINDKKVITHPFTPEMNEVFSGKTWVNNPLLNKIKLFVQFLIYPVVTSIFFVVYLILTFLLSLMGQIIAKIIFKLQLSFKESSRIIRVACTPQVVALSIALSFDISAKTILSSIFLAVYLSYAFLVIKQAKRGLRTTPFKEIR